VPPLGDLPPFERPVGDQCHAELGRRLVFEQLYFRGKLWSIDIYGFRSFLGGFLQFRVDFYIDIDFVAN
jgi:hypothetical protein